MKLGLPSTHQHPIAVHRKATANGRVCNAHGHRSRSTVSGKRCAHFSVFSPNPDNNVHISNQTFHSRHKPPANLTDWLPYLSKSECGPGRRFSCCLGITATASFSLSPPWNHRRRPGLDARRLTTITGKLRAKGLMVGAEFPMSPCEAGLNFF